MNGVVLGAGKTTAKKGKSPAALPRAPTDDAEPAVNTHR